MAATALVAVTLVLLVAANALPIFVVGLALAYLIDPPVTALEALGVPRALASVALIVVMMVVLVGFIVIVAATFLQQGEAFLAQAPSEIATIREWIARTPLDPTLRGLLEDAGASVAATLGSLDLVGLGSSIVGSFFGILGVVLGAIGVPFYVFIVVTDRPHLQAELEQRLPAPWRADILVVLGIISRQFGNYVRSEAILMVLLGGLTWIGLMVLSIIVDSRIATYAVFLAAVAAFSELIPLVGPWIAALPAVLFGLTLGPGPLLAIGALYVVISFFEGNVMVPAIEGRSFALRPAIVAPALAIGVTLGGTFGAVLALPVASAARDVYLYVFQRSMGLTPADAQRDPRPGPRSAR